MFRHTLPRALPLGRVRRSRRRLGRREASRTLGLITALVVAVGLLFVPTAAQGDTGDVGSVGPVHTGTGTPTGTKRAESVLWYNDGSWWGNLWDTRTSDFHIFRFDAGTGQWVDTGVTTDTRTNTHHDVLWDGTTLFVASHTFVADGVPAAAGFASTLRRYSYNTTSDTYTLASTTQINNMKTETLVIDKDTKGSLWATWQQGSQIYVNSTATDGTTWGTPFALPGGDVSVDDNASLVAFGPGKVGLLFDRESPSPGSETDGFYWSVHVDGDAPNDWSTPVSVVSGVKQGDDHMNLKWLDSSGGRVFAGVKTSFTSSAQPLIQLLAMDSTGAWTKTTIATVSECPNRVVLLIDEAAQRLRTFATYPKPSGTTNAGTCSSSGGAIYEKSTPLDNIRFTTDKTPRIVDADQYVHNVSSTKQNLNNARTGGASTANSGLMAIADVNATSTYWYYYEPSAVSPPTDTTPPDTAITSGPSGTTSATGASFDFSSSEAASGFECRLDGAAFGACTSPKTYSGLADGSHTFEVRATDAAGNTDASPAARTWSVDSSAPETTITAGPSGTVAATDASFEFSSSEAGSSFECRLDGAVFQTCTSPKAYSALGQGSHSFDVRAKDAAGNTDASPATRTWTVDSTVPDTTAPGTTITAGPSGTVAATGASFEFTSSEAGSTFECGLDGAAYESCGSPKSFTGLSEGLHTFEVRATDAAGNTDGTPATRTWTVDATAPDTTITAGPSGTVAATDASFEFTSSEAGSSFECKLDAGAFGACASPKPYSGLSEGEHTFEVRAKDAAGNSDATPAAQTWTVAPPPDTTAPDTTITGGPSGTVAATDASFTFASSEAGSSFQCRLDGGALATCSSPQSYPGLTQGLHTFEVQATDAAGNSDPTPVTRTWTVDSRPTAALTVSPASGIAPLQVTANASASRDPQGQSLTYAFSWGDGSATAAQPGATAGHTFEAAGSYVVTVTVTNTAGLSASATQTVTVSPAPAYVAQLGTASSATAVKSGVVTLDRAVAAGEMVVVTAHVTVGASKPVTATDSVGNTYALATSRSDGSGAKLSVLYGRATNALPAGAQITLSFAHNTAYRIAVDELTGVTTVDKDAAAAGSGTTFSSGMTKTTTAPRELVLGVVAQAGGSAAPSWATGWTPAGFSAVGTGYVGRAYRTPTAVGTFGASGTATAPWIAGVVTFR